MDMSCRPAGNTHRLWRLKLTFPVVAPLVTSTTRSVGDAVKPVGIGLTVSVPVGTVPKV